MASTAQAISEHRNAATPYLSVRNAAAAIEFYKRAFGATESLRLMQPDGRIGHAEINIGGARIMLADEFPEMGFSSPESLGGSPVHIHLDVADVDAVAARATAAGAKVVRPVADQFYGDRSGQISDPFGYTWVISTRKEEMSGAEMQRRLDAFMKSQTSAAEGEKKVSPIREGFKTITPYIIVNHAPELIDFVKQAFGAVESFRGIGSAGGLHCELKIGDSMLMIGGGLKYSGPVSPTAFHLSVPDVDAVYKRAVDAGATPFTPVKDEEYGARAGMVIDLAGNQWQIGSPLGPRENRPADMIPLPSQSVTIYLHPVPASAGIEFFKRAFSAEEVYRAQSPEGRIHYAQLRIGTSMLELSDAHGPYQPMPTTMFLYVEDTDVWYERAVKAGATDLNRPEDQPYGDRVGGVKDPFGNTWYIATHKETLSPQEEQRRIHEDSARRSVGTKAISEGEKAVNYIRAGFHTVTPYLVISGAAQWIDFMKRAFEAEEKFRTGPPGTDTIMHAELKIGDSMIEVADTNPQYPAMPSTLSIRASDPDAIYRRAIAAGAEAIEPMADKEYGTRAGIVRDVSGNSLFIFAPLPGDKSFTNLRGVTPHLYADSASQLIEFLRNAFGGEEVYRAQLPDGSVPHAQMRIGDSLIVLAGATGRGEYPPRPTSLHLYVPNTDALYEQALRAGAESIQPPTDQPYGDRSAGVRDPFGNLWFIATHVRDVTG